MILWIKSLRLSLCFLAGLLTVAGFRLEEMQTPWLVAITISFITCSTMLQNDWRDRHHDDRKGKLLALRYPRAFVILLFTFWVVAGGLILVVSIKNSNVGTVLIGIALAGLIYSETRQIPIVPVTLVALTSGSPALLSIVMGADGNQSWLLFLSTILIVFGREITKDIDDEEADNGYKWTIPLVVGKQWAKAIAIIVITAGLVVANQISVVILPAILLVTFGIALLACNVKPKVTRICMDIGIALAILSFIFIK